MPKQAHQIRNVVRYVQETPWAIYPPKLAEICDFLNARAEGQIFSRDEIRQRVRAASGGDEPRQRPSYQVTEDGIAVIPLLDVLAPRMNLLMEFSGGTSTTKFAQQIRDAAADEEIRAIVVPIDSPGGSVLGLENAVEAMRDARGQKPVVAVAIGMMASAAYYIGSAATEIVVAADAMVGSIGTVSVHVDTSEADKKAGRKYTVIAAGDYKWAEHGYAPLSETGRATIQELVDSFYEQFVSSVAQSRGISPKRVREDYGRGKVLIGTRAVQAGLADRIGTFDDVLAELGRMLAPAAGNPSTLLSEERESTMDPRIIQALVAKGLLNPAASHDLASAVLAGWYAGRGSTKPEDSAVDQIVADLTQAGAAPPPQPAAAATPPAAPPAAAEPAPVQSAAANVAVEDRIRQQAAAAERDRIANLRARGELLGVDAAHIDAAVDAGTSVEQFLLDSTRSAARRETPVQRIESGEASRDKYQAAAVDALLLRGTYRPPNHQPVAGAAALRQRPLLWFAEESLRVSGGRAPVGDRDDVVLAALGDQEAGARVLAGGQPLQGPGSFPNLLSAVANKTLEGAPQYVGTTYQNWAYRRPSVPDFKPSTLVRYGEFGEFPLHVDGDNFEQSELSEDFSWIQVDSYGDEFGLTPVMIVNDDLGAFLDALVDKQNAHDQTLNRLCVNLLTGNVVCGDGVVLFHTATHGNNVAAGSGGAPSTAQLSAMRLLLRSQTGVSAKRKLNYTVRRILIPEALETVTQQLLAQSLGIYPTTETATPIFKGQAAWDVEPMLTDDSAVKWYAMMDPAVARSIVYCHQTGYESMKRRDYYNPQNNCRMFQFEGRFAAAVNNWRGIARNAGA